MVADPVSEGTVAVARTVASPVAVEQRAVVATPPWVTTEMSGSRFCWKTELARSVVKLTPVPSGTLLPFRVTRAWIAVQDPAIGFALLVKRRICSGLEPEGPGVLTLGGVGLGASDEQYQLAAPRRATPTGMLTIRRMASLPLSLPIPGYRGSRCEIEVQDPGGGLTLDPLARARLA